MTREPLPPIRFRPALNEDRAFLFQTYASTRAAELSPLPWTPEQKQAFLAQQFEAQDADYRKNYEEAEFLIIQVDGRDAGRLYLLRSPGDILLIDIALIENERAAGVGTRILNDLVAEADGSSRTITLYVEHFNPALRLYQRLGFGVVEDAGVYLRLVKKPGAAKG